jgi:hypothetical protein
MSASDLIMARFVEKQVKSIYSILGKKIENRGFTERIEWRHGDCKKSVEYDEEY